MRLPKIPKGLKATITKLENKAKKKAEVVKRKKEIEGLKKKAEALRTKLRK